MDKSPKRILYRDHRGGFDESMATARPVTREMLVAHLADTHGPLESVDFEHVGLDARNGWNTYMVVMNGKAVGHSDGVFAKPTERAPLLSNMAIQEECIEGFDDPFDLNREKSDGAHWVRDFYEAKITSGELIVASPILVWTGGQNAPGGQWYQKDMSPLPDQHVWVPIGRDEYHGLIRKGARVHRL